MVISRKHFNIKSIGEGKWIFSIAQIELHSHWIMDGLSANLTIL